MKKQATKTTFAGKTLTTKEWSKATGIKKSTLKSRLGRAKEDQAKIEAALTNGASEAFIASLKPVSPAIEVDFSESPVTVKEVPEKKVRKKREAQTIQVDLTGGSISITRHVNNSIEVLDADGKALNAAKTLRQVDDEKGLKIQERKEDGSRKLNTRAFGKEVLEALTA